MNLRLPLLPVLLVLASCSITTRPDSGGEAPLPSWADGPAKAAIVDFVTRVTDPGGPDFVPAAERVAVFDNDGTLWAEQPAYFQLLFALDGTGRTLDSISGLSEKELVGILLESHSGLTTTEFAASVREWLETARHPKTGRPYTEMVYRPQLELLEYLRSRGFRTWIVSGGGIDFMRVFAEEVYGVPPEQVVGSTIRTEFEMRDGVPVLVRRPKLDFIDDKEGKPVGIHRSVGRRPILAFGNSDGDLPMLQWTAAGPGARLMLLLHHDDAAREWAYDRESHIGRLDRALDQARDRGWTVVSVKSDWKRVF